MSSTSKDLVLFDALKAQAMKLVAPTLTAKVTSFKESEAAIEAGKTIKALKKELKSKYDAVAGPLNDQLAVLRDIKRSIDGPLDDAEAHLKRQLGAFVEAQQKFQEAERRKEQERQREIERKAEEERQRLAAEAEERRLKALAEVEAKSTHVADAGSVFGSSLSADDHLEAERQSIEDKAEQDRLEADAKAEREKKIREGEAQAREWDIKQKNVKNARTIYRVELIDLEQVPKEFLVRTLNEKAIIAAHKAKASVPGVKVIEEMTVAFGSNTRVPRAAHEAERLPRGGE